MPEKSRPASALVSRLDQLQTNWSASLTESESDTLDEIKAVLAALSRGGSSTGETPTITGSTSDGYHTFDELYSYRKAYNALLFNEWAGRGLYDVHKSWHHSDGEPCFGGGWFIVIAETPAGQISNHYKSGDWDLFRVSERERGNVYDGHTPAMALDRLLQMAALSAPSSPQEWTDEVGLLKAMLQQAQTERDEYKALASVGTWHDDCRPNRHMAAREIQKSQAVIDKLADTISTLNAKIEKLTAPSSPLPADYETNPRACRQCGLSLAACFRWRGGQTHQPCCNACDHEATFSSSQATKEQS